MYLLSGPQLPRLPLSLGQIVFENVYESFKIVSIVYKMSLKDEKISFSEQISARLHRWVQRTSIKVRNEKAQSVRINNEENQDVISESQVNKSNPRDVISESQVNKSNPREDFARRSRESRSYEELEKALKDLINNCVTSSSVSREGNDNTNINITREKNNNMKLETTTKTNCKNVGECVSPSGSDCVQEKNYSVTSLETNVDALPHCDPKQSDVGETLTKKKVKESSEKTTVNENEANVFSLEENEGNVEHEERDGEDFNNFSNAFDSCEINSSLSNVNKGLNTPIDRLSLETTSSQNVARRLDKKPPLRRIQSEGDALELKLCFKDNDVTEFAATCIRHAEKKRCSDTTPVYRSVDSSSLFSKLDYEGSELESSFQCSISNLPDDKESDDILKNVQTIPEVSLGQVDDETDGNLSTVLEHVSLSQRPSSLSFPLETPKRRNKTSSLKNKVFRHSPSTPPRSVLSSSVPVPSPSVPVPISPQSSLSSPNSSRSTPSPKFRRFPCQPVFYIPKSNESRTSPNSTRSGLVGEQSKEYLI